MRADTGGQADGRAHRPTRSPSGLQQDTVVTQDNLVQHSAVRRTSSKEATGKATGRQHVRQREGCSAKGHAEAESSQGIRFTMKGVRPTAKAIFMVGSSFASIFNNPKRLYGSPLLTGLYPPPDAFTAADDALRNIRK
ncbi:hypothetical protein E2C01_054147 [Portunus trituberculatus]|uniref:Uncharacterized protein n=1 Tax=Portunus trituberculatus TaxID=210409 RepID=A0A5B7GR84_PORTR|nr:hypothetical protein [Portunus trituberculatus]